MSKIKRPQRQGNAAPNPRVAETIEQEAETVQQPDAENMEAITDDEGFSEDDDQVSPESAEPDQAPTDEADVKSQLYTLLKIREISLIIPAQDGQEGDNRQTHVDVQRLTHLQERGMSLLYYGLVHARETFGPGNRLVDSKADAVRWLFEQIAQADQSSRSDAV